jgi:hypothetical protein
MECHSVFGQQTGAAGRVFDHLCDCQVLDQCVNPNVSPGRLENKLTCAFGL